MLEKTYTAYNGLDISDDELEELFSQALSKALSDINHFGQVIIIPPDISRIHSRAGFLTEIAALRLGSRLGAVLPALGTHRAMTESELSMMFGKVPLNKFLTHNWRDGIIELGRLKKKQVEEITEGAVSYDWPIEVNKILQKDNTNGNPSLIVSIGQVVPHEVAGMANHAKNIFIGTGGKEAIDKSHFAGAAYGMERIIGRTNTPVRTLFDEGISRFGALMPPVLWVLTVIGKKARGLFIGFGRECFEKAAALAQKVNINTVDEPVHKAVVYLNPDEYRTMWLGNKAIYRTRMAIADGGELIVIAPALERFGEDSELDAVIRKYGYCSRAEIIDRISLDTGLAENLCAAAHLIHGSTDGRFTVRYCPGNRFSRKEIESVGYKWGCLPDFMEKYDTNNLIPGWNNLNGERIYFVPNPALGLWTIQNILRK